MPAYVRAPSSRARGSERVSRSRTSASAMTNKNQPIRNNFSAAAFAQPALSCSSCFLLTYILLLFSDAILRIIGRQGAAILVRVMGIILCLTRGGNRADDIGSGKLGARFALEFL